MNEHTSISSFIELRSTCSTYHLKKICEWEVNISSEFGIIEFSALYDDQPSWEVNSPSKSTSSYQYLYLLFNKQIFYNLSILLCETSMMHTDSKLNSLSEIFIFNKFRYLMYLFWIHFQERPIKHINIITLSFLLFSST